MNPWRYSLRWRNPFLPCPGERILMAVDVPAGAPVPESVMARWVAGGPYCISLDFIQDTPVKRWSDERKARVRRANLQKRVMKAAPLFAEEIIERELSTRPEYFQGK